jgi:predicted nucleic acid-binding protein
VPGVLLDSNHVQHFYQQRGSIVAKVNALPSDAVVLGCAISLGEIAAGHEMTKPKDAAGQAIRDGYIKWLNEKFAPNAIDVTIAVATSYAELIGRIWANHPPSGKNRHTEQHLFRQGGHKATLAYLVSNGVDINDVWCVAVAMAYGLTFVTTDAINWIREAAGNDVNWDCWLEKSPSPFPIVSPPPSGQSPNASSQTTSPPAPSLPSAPPASPKHPRQGS